MIVFKRKGSFDEKRNVLCKLVCFNNDILVFLYLNMLIFIMCMVFCWLFYYKNSFVKRIVNVIKEWNNCKDLM